MVTKIHLIPTNPIKSPAAARKRLLARMDQTIPIITVTIPMMIKVFLPIISPINDNVKEAKVLLANMNMIARLRVVAYESHL